MFIPTNISYTSILCYTIHYSYKKNAIKSLELLITWIVRHTKNDIRAYDSIFCKLSYLLFLVVKQATFSLHYWKITTVQLRILSYKK